MATMLNGAAVMDGALLLIAANETCPQPQTSEHLAAVEIMKLQHIIILQNKIDLIRRVPCKLLVCMKCWDCERSKAGVVAWRRAAYVLFSQTPVCAPGAMVRA